MISNETLLLILPVVWGILAAVIALLLYKSSKSLIEGLSIPGMPAKSVRIAGSAAIFVIAFFLLQNATAGDGVLVPKAKFGEMRDSVARLDGATVDLAGCAAIDDTLSLCAQHVKAVRLEAQKVRQLLEEEDPSRPADE